MFPSYSYQGQDRFVLNVLGPIRGGYFLDSGASDGLRGSNSRLFETELGWRGICVEPNDQLFEVLARNRSCICLNCCLYDVDGDVEFLESAAVYGGIVTEYDPQHLAFARSKSDGSAPTTKRARTIRSVLQECGAPPTIDYWSLDTEGSELTLLRSFPFDEYRVRVLTVEHNEAPVRHRIRAFLASKGFELAASLGIDDAFVWTGGERTSSWRSRSWTRWSP